MDEALTPGSGPGDMGQLHWVWPVQQHTPRSIQTCLPLGPQTGLSTPTPLLRAVCIPWAGPASTRLCYQGLFLLDAFLLPSLSLALEAQAGAARLLAG